MPLLGLSDDTLSHVVAALVRVACDAETCDALCAMRASCRALRAVSDRVRSFGGAYVFSDSPLVCASAHRAGLVFDPIALGARLARDFLLFPRMRALVSATEGIRVQRGSAPLERSSVELYTSLLLRCAALGSSARWTHRVTEMCIRGSWLGTCAEVASFTNLRSLALVECRCHTVAGLAELDLETLTVDALAFYGRRCDGGYFGPLVEVARETLAPIRRVRRLFVRNTPARPVS